MIELCVASPSVPVEVDVSPADGGRVARLAVAGRDLLVTGDASTGPMQWGSYPMVPFAGRVGGGRLAVGDRTLQLPCNLPPHAIHGTGFTSPWDVLDAGLDHAELSVRLNWPLGGTAHQHLQLTADALVCVLTVVADDRPMPVTLGWHPWFVKPDADRFDFGSMYERGPDHLPTGRFVAPTPRPWDDCFVDARTPPRLSWSATPTHPAIEITVDSDCDHWVVYDEPAHATCVEPQSGPPDAARLGAAALLAPGEMLQRTMTVRWSVTSTG